MNRPVAHFLKALILAWTLLLVSATAVTDDGNPDTRAGLFSMEQEPPDTRIIKYYVFYWKDGTDRSTATKVEFPSPAQTGTKVYVEVVIDGFVQGQKYNATGRAASADEESEDCPTISFTMPTYLASPKMLKFTLNPPAPK